MVSNILKLLKSGDEVISTNDLYGGSFRLFKTIFEKYGIKFHFVSMIDTSAIEEKINETINKLQTEGYDKINYFKLA